MTIDPGLSRSSPRQGSRKSKPSAQIRRRGESGQFLPTYSSERYSQSLSKHRKCQEEYMKRRKSLSKRLYASFLNCFTVRNESSVHWIPGCMKESPLQTLFLKLVKDVIVESRTIRHSSIRFLYWNGDPRLSKKRLPTIRTRPANNPHVQLKRVAALVGWRFPVPTSEMEMTTVRNWIENNKNMLKISSDEAILECFNTFCLYRKQGEKYFYSSYPAVTERENSKENRRTPQLSSPERHIHDPNLTTTNGSSLTILSPPRPGEGELQVSQCELFAKTVIELASDATISRSLKIALDSPSSLHRSITCAMWAETSGKQDKFEWCGLRKDLLQYCILSLRGDNQNAQYSNLKGYLTDQLNLFKLIRQSLNLPIYEEDAWKEILQL